MLLRQEARQTISLAIPLIFGEIAQEALKVIDTAMVGAVGYKQLAAVALIGSFMNIPFVLGIGITLAVSQMVSLAHGRNDKKLTSHYFYNGFWLCAGAGLIISLGLELSKGALFHLGQDPEVVKLGIPYLQLMAWSLLPMLMFFALKQFTDGLQFTRVGMVLSVIALPLNAFLNWLLIFGHWGFPRLEIIGAGWGTLITRILIFIALGIIVLRHRIFKRYIAVRYHEWYFHWGTIRELLHIGIPSSLQIAMEAGAFAVSGILVGMIGAVALAAHQIALSLASLTFVISIGLSQAGSIRTSNAYGANNRIKMGRIGKSTLITALIYGGSCAILFIFLRNQIPLLFNDNMKVVTLASALLLFAAVFQISDSVQATSAGLLRGIKDMKIPTVFIGIAYWVIGIPVGCLLAFTFDMGAAGIWIGLILGLTASAIFLSKRFLKMSK